MLLTSLPPLILEKKEEIVDTLISSTTKLNISPSVQMPSSHITCKHQFLRTIKKSNWILEFEVTLLEKISLKTSHFLAFSFFKQILLHVGNHKEKSIKSG